jgi:chemotaxis protein histidine kinase CheA
MRFGAALCGFALALIGSAASAQGLVTAQPAPADQLESAPATAAVRESFGACRPLAAETLRVRLDSASEGVATPEAVTLLTAQCPRGRMQFLHIRMEREDEPEDVLVQQLPRADFQGLAADPATRRIFARLPNRERYEELRWQPAMRNYLVGWGMPLQDYAGLLLPAVPTGPAPLVAASTPPPAAAAAPRSSDELRAEVEAELRQRLTAEVREQFVAEVQARLDAARAIVENLERELGAERAAKARAEAALTERDRALAAERVARETAERLLGLSELAASERAARERVEQALGEARAAERTAQERAQSAAAALAQLRAEAAQAQSAAAAQRSAADAAQAAAERALGEARSRIAELEQRLAASPPPGFATPGAAPPGLEAPPAATAPAATPAPDRPQPEAPAR